MGFAYNLVLFHSPLAQRIFGVLLVGAVALPLTGCLTIRRGSTQIVSIESTPPGATVLVQPGGQSTDTPVQLPMARRYDQTLLFKKAGYWDRTVIVKRSSSSGLWRNLVWVHPIGWLIGVIVDLSTGSGYDLEPESVSVELVALPLAARNWPGRNDEDVITCQDGSIYIGSNPDGACPNDP